jgi:hypothetical protein
MNNSSCRGRRLPIAIARLPVEGRTPSRIARPWIYFNGLLMVLPAYAVVPAGSVSYGAGSPATPAAGQVTASGTYTVAAGWSVGAPAMSVVPVKGGITYSGVGAPAAGGNWGPVTINNIPKRQYSVNVVITFTKPGQMSQTIATGPVVVNVP